MTGIPGDTAEEGVKPGLKALGVSGKVCLANCAPSVDGVLPGDASGPGVMVRL